MGSNAVGQACESTSMIIWINGPINAGKSTIARILARKLPKAAHIEVDDLHGFIEWMPLEEAIPICLENAVALIHNFVQKGLNVVISYPLSQEDYNYVTSELRDIPEKIHTFTLSPSKKVALSNRGDRELDDWERSRIAYHYRIQLHKPKFGIIIDNTSQTPDQTSELILDHLSESVSRTAAQTP